MDNKVTDRDTAAFMYNAGMAHGMLIKPELIERLEEVEGIPASISQQLLDAFKAFREANLKAMFFQRGRTDQNG